jgi:hypothetical protein
MARPAFSPTPEQRRAALRLAKIGISDREIARHLRIDRKTLVRSHLGGECFDARLKLKAKLLRALVKKTLPAYDDDYRQFGDVAPLLRRLDRADVGGDDAENEAKGDENDAK